MSLRWPLDLAKRRRLTWGTPRVNKVLKVETIERWVQVEMREKEVETTNLSSRNLAVNREE